MKKEKVIKVKQPIIKIKKIKPEPVIPYIVASTTTYILDFNEN